MAIASIMNINYAYLKAENKTKKSSLQTGISYISTEAAHDQLAFTSKELPPRLVNSLNEAVATIVDLNPEHYYVKLADVKLSQYRLIVGKGLKKYPAAEIVTNPSKPLHLSDVHKAFQHHNKLSRIIEVDDAHTARVISIAPEKRTEALEQLAKLPENLLVKDFAENGLSFQTLKF